MTHVNKLELASKEELFLSVCSLWVSFVSLDCSRGVGGRERSLPGVISVLPSFPSTTKECDVCENVTHWKRFWLPCACSDCNGKTSAFHSVLPIWRMPMVVYVKLTSEVTLIGWGVSIKNASLKASLVLRMNIISLKFLKVWACEDFVVVWFCVFFCFFFCFYKKPCADITKWMGFLVCRK